MRMQPKDYVCIHEEQIQGQSRKIAALDAKSNYKEKIIMELHTNIKELNKNVETLDKTINDYILKSIDDDSKLKDIINKQDQRITKLESRLDTLYKLLIAIPSIIALLGFIGLYIH